MNSSEDYLKKIRQELGILREGKDDGMLPVYSLLSEWLEVSGLSSSFIEAAERLQSVIGDLFDLASPMTAYAINSIREFVDWSASVNPEEVSDSMPAFSAIEESHEISECIAEEIAELDILLEVNVGDDEDVLEEFYSEANEHLQQIETDLLELENNPGEEDALSSLFRSFHTIKGVAGFLNLKPIQSLAHEIEFLLDKARNHKLTLNTESISLILKSKDCLSELVTQVSESLYQGKTPDRIIPISHLILDARCIQEGKTIPQHDKPMQDNNSQKQESAPPVLEKTAPVSDITALAAEPSPQSESKAVQKSSSIRVNTAKLDSLLDTVGELVITQSQLMESSKALGDESASHLKHLSQLTRISKELQHTSMSLRMVPIGSTFQKMGRIVRDVSTKLNKEVNFTVSGEDTELDRSIVELIGDPLVHMVRNAVDHGIESPELRSEKGKNPRGQVDLRAYHLGGNIIIDLKDDGKGMNPEYLLEKARAKGLVPENQHFSEQEIYQFVFLPGFSTAETVTDVSGRGVGMDVVKRNIEQLRGTVTIDSTQGMGSLFRIKLPLTTAIIDGLLVRVGNDRFIIPTLSVKVTLRPESSQVKRMQGNSEILDLRGQSIPIVRLHEQFDISGASHRPEDSILIIIETMGRPIALMVDDLLGKQEVVIKSLGETMRKLPGIAGGAILGDGSVALILDPSNLSAQKNSLKSNAA